MDRLREFSERDGEGVLADTQGGQYSGMQSVQNMETVINEGIREALLAEHPDQSLDTR